MSAPPDYCIDGYIAADGPNDLPRPQLDDAVLQELLPPLRRLDARLEEAVRQAQAHLGETTADEHYRGLYVDDDEVTRLLAAEPGATLFNLNGQSAAEGWLTPTARLYRLASAYGLTDFDLDLLLIALAPELDRRYERIYAYLQDHVARRWPTVDLALHLLCTDALQRLARRAHFAATAPLLWQTLLHLIPDQDAAARGLLAATLKIDAQIVNYLLHQNTLDERLVDGGAYLATRASLVPYPALVAALLPAVAHAWTTKQPLYYYFQGLLGVGKCATAQALAEAIQAPLLVLDLRRLAAQPDTLLERMQLAIRHAQLYETLLYLDHVDALYATGDATCYQRLLTLLAQHTGVVFLAGQQSWQAGAAVALGVNTVSFALPTYRERLVLWQHQLAQADTSLSEPDLATLTNRFRLTPAQIAEALAMAHALAYQQNPLAPMLTLPALSAAARAQCGHAVAKLAHKIEPRYGWLDLVLPADELAQLQEICQRVAQQPLVLDEWGFGRKLAMGKGINVLFAGPSGAGKTMAAEVIAHELGIDLYKIDLASVVSKYIGETEKNLDQIFTAAENANAILFFDEADALFGKRSEVSDAHDRYANIEISYLLQKMEEYDGVTILATNLRQNLDDAFLRRLAFAIHFPFPDEVSRLHIWQGIWPKTTPLAADVDLGFMASQFKLAGGNIKNIALAAAFLAASAGSAVTMPHLLQATQREYQKLGKGFNRSELGKYAQELLT